MTIKQAKSELMQIYGALSPDKQRAIDTLVKIEPCKDTIPRTAAINLVNDVQNNCGFSDYEYYEYLYDHLSTLPSVNPQEPKWIPVGKKSPVAFDKVLVTYRLHYDDSIHIGIGNTTSNINGRYYWNINEQDLVGWDILAWMPLPKPYESQERSDKV